MVRAADFVAQRGGDIELTARGQAKTQGVEHSTCRPVAIGYPGHGGEAHARCFADHLEDGGHSIDAADRGNVGMDGVGH
ncbi:hypothetical protein D3C80_1889350 [compost metagenome]